MTYSVNRRGRRARRFERVGPMRDFRKQRLRNPLPGACLSDSVRRDLSWRTYAATL